MAGLAALTVRKRTVPLQSAESTRRAILYALLYGLCSAAFMRVIGAAVYGLDRSPWLLALGDVIFLALGLFTWVIALAEGHGFAAIGFRPMPAGRLLLTLMMGLGPVVFYAFQPYRQILWYQVHASTDTLAFALLYAGLGSAVPDEVIFRGLLMGSLEGRASQWSRLVWPALLYTAVRSLRVLPGVGFGADDWMFYIFGLALPLGLWWGLMRELAGGALWPCLVSHFLLEFGTALTGASPAPR